MIVYRLKIRLIDWLLLIGAIMVGVAIGAFAAVELRHKFVWEWPVESAQKSPFERELPAAPSPAAGPEKEPDSIGSWLEVSEDPEHVDWLRRSGMSLEDENKER